jgi:GNAT superfamily N-acetyltransferase
MIDTTTITAAPALTSETAPALTAAAAPVVAAQARWPDAGSRTVLRAAEHADVTAIAALWHRGWRDGHLGNVPEGLHAHRDLDSFLQLVPPRLAETTVATLDNTVVGFVTVHDDEIEQIYVAEAVRGAGVAAVLLAAGEHRIAARFDMAWLAVVAGNHRARRFYARQGWRDAGPFDYLAATLTGRFLVPAHRYEKPLATSSRGR